VLVVLDPDGKGTQAARLIASVKEIKEYKRIILSSPNKTKEVSIVYL